ncbi:hypothetical protein N180_03885 [Pedobacter antarcticus 4BY]|uniref:Glutathionylspermidine synthase pre-ATP-grasp-like domain-containing protein n=2 Tax=Pedobacter antarcticus TaxID=34086 RepID=A0A081PFN6_9SPHI|nr:hypothetical protein [Pedobacter antarcticus]KEQ29509.1 hypothetical protein N180_03885 [Pedobacter antarcticus 4BY]SFF10890.1 hypothetical protein SAMN03003324_02423 [Pedobacter antarcticus]
MIPKYRKAFNESFSEEKYAEFIGELEAGYRPVPIRFAETPIFLPDAFKEKLIDAGAEILRIIKNPDFKAQTENAIPAEWFVPGENDHPHFLAFDFAVCRDQGGELVPRLIELQGFPSLYAFQMHLAETYIKVFQLEDIAHLTPFFNGMDSVSFTELLREVILGPCQPEEVALMDVNAAEQKTAIDFFVTAGILGIPVLSLTDIFQEDKQLFYLKDGQKIRLKRIYNRLIFDEVANQQDLFNQSFDPREELDIEWITHPNWFYRISKYTMPLLKNEFVPETTFVSELQEIPADLENYVLKPLFSFAGMGVIIDVTEQDITDIQQPENWILQRKVNYEPIVQAPDGLIKAEIRLLYLWPDGKEPTLCINLARLSRGKMIGVRYNQDFDWVGGTVGLMESLN